MDKDYVDKYIQESLYNHETEIDNDLLWAAIEQRKTKGGFRIFGILSMLAVVLIAGFALFYMQNTSNLKSTLNEKITANILGNNNSNNQNSVSVIDNKTSQTQSLNEDGKANVDLENSITQIDDNTLLIEQENILDATQFNNNNKTILISNSNTTQSSNYTNENNVSLKNSYSKLDKKSAKNKNSNNKNITGTSNDRYSNFSSNSKRAITSSNDLIDKSIETLTENKIAIKEAISLNVVNRQITSLAQLENQSIFLSNETLIFPSVQQTDCPTFGSKKRNLYLQAYSIFDYVSTNFESTPEDDNYLNERERTQSYLPSIRAGIQAKYLFNNGFYVKGGFEYGTVRENYKDRVVDTLVSIEPNQLISYFETSPGDTTFIFGNAPVTTISATNWDITNSYKTIDIPVLIGYQINKGNWTYGLEIGVINNIKLTTKSFILDSDLMPRLAPDYYKTSIKQSLTGGISLGYGLTPDIKLLGLLQFKQNLTFINSTANPINQKNLHIGLGAGLEYRF